MSLRLHPYEWAAKLRSSRCCLLAWKPQLGLLHWLGEGRHVRGHLLLLRRRLSKRLLHLYLLLLLQIVVEAPRFTTACKW